MLDDTFKYISQHQFSVIHPEGLLLIILSFQYFEIITVLWCT